MSSVQRPDYKRAKIGVWWDMSDCPVPEGYDARLVGPRIEEVLMSRKFSGPVSINAYGDLRETSDEVLERLSCTGVNVSHTISDVTCERILRDLMEWRKVNPPPAVMMLISNRVDDFMYWALSRLQQETKNYLLLLAYSRRSITRTWSVLFYLYKWRWNSILGVGVSQKKKKTRRCAQRLSETAGILLSCKLCSTDYTSLGDFRVHLLSTQHTLEENRINPSISLAKFKHPLESSLGLQRMWGVNSPADPRYANAQIHVFWDMMDCPIPDAFDARRFRPTIQSAFDNLGYTGPVSISAYCNVTETPQLVLEGLLSTGVSVIHCLSDVMCSRMFRDFRYCMDETPTPATAMFISDSVESVLVESLASVQQWLKCNLFLASNSMPSKTSLLLTLAEWLWETLLSTPLTTRHLEEGSESTGMLSCKLCSRDFKSMDRINRHLSTKNHLKEVRRIKLIARNRAGCYDDQDESTPSPKRKRA